ncbi:hypothetical protein HYH02_004463 [Chlamydomonas schloesseri]|uniref:Indoleamine 2,3-dioxygenase n=1 Tax=Chlamydomonas schloesseri TaxID=2026947 RepID=A0A836B8G2_9CHLO|nr:hypothetical protein HYH02_004463 [Chlamydomonas schloesseri]|eukprot:KAG2450623.1 hypothetical protein HYH02_004463 [Chlamydomonas schloesseri]
MVLSFLSHAYVWCEPGPPPAVLPAVLAVPWARAAAAVGMPPVLTYATYNLLNWRRLDPSLPPLLDNLASINNFLGGPDEEWFRLVHVDIEARAGPAVAGLARLQQAAAQDDAGGVLLGLGAISAALRAMQATLARIGERCEPQQYYTRVRPPIAGWRNSPQLPQGLVYEGMYGGAPVQLYGATGAQSSVVPAFDRVLDIRHEQGRLRDYLDAMVAHMPPPHRAFLARLAAANANDNTNMGLRGGQQPAAAANVRSYVLAAAASGSSHSRGGELRDAYDCAVEELERFRSLHRAVAQRFIVQPASATAPSSASPAAASRPTGGTVSPGAHHTHAAEAPAACGNASAAAPSAHSGSLHASSHKTSAAASEGRVAPMRFNAAAGAAASATATPQREPPLAQRPPAPAPAAADGSGAGGSSVAADRTSTGTSPAAAGASGDGLVASAAAAVLAEAAASAEDAAAAAVAEVTGTGGSDVIPALTSFRDATRRHKIAAAAASTLLEE